MSGVCLDSRELSSLLSRVPGLVVGVIGDFCLDIYWDIDNSRNEESLETGLVTNAVRQERRSPGGAGNVVMNLKALGVGEVKVFGVIGEDPYGAELIRLLKEPVGQHETATGGIDAAGLIFCSDWHTHLFIKPVQSGREDARYDIGNYNVMHKASETAVLSALEEAWSSLDLLIINQQIMPGAGVHSHRFRRALVDCIVRHADVLCVVDSRDYAADFGPCIRKMNDRELALRCREAGIKAQTPLAMAIDLAAAWDTPLVVTRAEKETLVAENGRCDVIPAFDTAGETIDPVGGGDSFIAGLAAAKAAGFSLVTGARLGTLCAGVSIRKRGTTGSASPSELRNLNETGRLLYHPELAGLPLAARQITDPDFEVIAPRSETAPITHAVFDHDGTISVLREGWEGVMEPMMIDCILGHRKAAVTPEEWQQVQRRVAEYIDYSTGVQTLIQMRGLRELVREFGYVKEEDVLSPLAYKAIYNKALMKMVNDRTDRMAAGELSVEDFSLKGAIPFLTTLAEKGVMLYLASGTDQEDVRNEARLMGYAELFTGGIYGSVGRMDADAKKEVLGRVLRDVGHTRLVTFGDGPVEIRETARMGGYTVGIASDEIRRYGWNPAKRRRLIRAGADLLIPDFSKPGKLLKLMGLT